jgi:hypothetical protein
VALEILLAVRSIRFQDEALVTLKRDARSGRNLVLPLLGNVLPCWATIGL